MPTHSNYFTQCHQSFEWQQNYLFKPEASTHKSAMTHTTMFFVTFDLLTTK